MKVGETDVLLEEVDKMKVHSIWKALHDNL